MVNEKLDDDVLSFADFIKKYKYKRSDEVIAYELYLILKKLDGLEGNVV